jgi:hypothetical protein
MMTVVYLDYPGGRIHFSGIFIKYLNIRFRLNVFGLKKKEIKLLKTDWEIVFKIQSY